MQRKCKKKNTAAAAGKGAPRYGINTVYLFAPLGSRLASPAFAVSQNAFKEPLPAALVPALRFAFGRAPSGAFACCLPARYDCPPAVMQRVPRSCFAEAALSLRLIYFLRFASDAGSLGRQQHRDRYLLGSADASPVESGCGK